MLKIPRNVRHVCVIFLMIFNVQSCVQWSWEADPYEALVSIDEEPGYIENWEGDKVHFDDPTIEEYTCFSQDNMASLIFNIKRLKINNREGQTVKSNLIDKLTR